MYKDSETSIAYSAMGKTWEAASRQPVLALRLLTQMRGSRCLMDPVAYSAAAEACDGSGDHLALLDWQLGSLLRLLGEPRMSNCESSSLALLS